VDPLGTQVPGPVTVVANPKEKRSVPHFEIKGNKILMHTVSYGKDPHASKGAMSAANFATHILEFQVIRAMMGIGSMIGIMMVSRSMTRKLPSYQPHGLAACTMNGTVGLSETFKSQRMKERTFVGHVTRVLVASFAAILACNWYTMIRNSSCALLRNS
jgi:hypothetical protein